MRYYSPIFPIKYIKVHLSVKLILIFVIHLCDIIDERGDGTKNSLIQ